MDESGSANGVSALFLGRGSFDLPPQAALTSHRFHYTKSTKSGWGRSRSVGTVPDALCSRNHEYRISSGCVSTGNAPLVPRPKRTSAYNGRRSCDCRSSAQ